MSEGRPAKKLTCNHCEHVPRIWGGGLTSLSPLGLILGLTFSRKLLKEQKKLYGTTKK